MNNSDKLYQKLDEIRSEIKGKGADCVFKTYVGCQYAASTNRLMIVGKATAGWDRSDSRDFVLKEVSSGNYHSHFWHFVKKLSYDLNKIDSEQAELRSEFFMVTFTTAGVPFCRRPIICECSQPSLKSLS